MTRASTRDGDGRRPSREEFLGTIEAEFSFLVAEDGYSMAVTDDYCVDFVKGPYRMQIIGASYGLAIDMHFSIDGKYFPVWYLAARKDRTRRTPRTDAPQLDAIRESAWWFKNELRGFFQGKSEYQARVEAIQAEVRREEESLTRNHLENKSYSFFSRVEELFRAKEYAECVRQLESAEFPLTKVWKARLEYAKKKS